jgi:hypothetical protein
MLAWSPRLTGDASRVSFSPGAKVVAGSAWVDGILSDDVWDPQLDPTSSRHGIGDVEAGGETDTSLQKHSTPDSSSKKYKGSFLGPVKPSSSAATRKLSSSTKDNLDWYYRPESISHFSLSDGSVSDAVLGEEAWSELLFIQKTMWK